MILGVEASYLSAFLVALLGGVHCVGMCGGIVGALTLGLPQADRTRERLPFLLAYNAGRILSYTAAGALVGGVGAVAGNLSRLYAAQLVLQLVAALFMIVLGLYVAGWWNGLLRVEQIGGRLIWQRLQPLGRRLLPVQTPARAFQLGLLWGWLPCGLVYSVLIWSVAAGSAGQGAALMLSFGLGTLPTLMAMGTFAAVLTVWVRRPAVRQVAGGLIIALALMQVYAVWRGVAAA